MEAKAIAKYIRISPIKVKRLVDLVRGKILTEAVNILTLTDTKASRAVEKVVKSAAANAENNHGMNPANLYVAEIKALQGPTMKRYRAGSRGSGKRILKRSSHISVVLKEKEA